MSHRDIKVPFIDLTRLAKQVGAAARSDIGECLERCEFVGGPRVTALEQLLASQLGANHAVACANGTDALVVGLRVLGVGPGTKVAMPNLTFWATYEAIAQVGAVPVLVDIDPDDLQMGFDAFVRAHEAHRFGAAIFVHLFGWTSARLGELRSLCQARSIRLLEDGAQAYGVTSGGRSVFADADVATLSFYPAKVVGGAMDGGAILLRTKEDAAKARALCNHGRADHYSYSYIGYNSRMAGIQAAYLLCVCKMSEAIVDERRRVTASYRDALRQDLPGVRLYGPPEGVVENGYLLPITSERHEGDAIVRAMAEHGIGCARTYPETIDLQPPAADAIRAGTLDHGRAFCHRVVNPPIFYGIRPDEQESVVRALTRVLTA